MRLCFYSRLVRLKLDSLSFNVDFSRRFLFQIGAIKTSGFIMVSIYLIKFLFQIGAIKTFKDAFVEMVKSLFLFQIGAIKTAS